MSIGSPIFEKPVLLGDTVDNPLSKAHQRSVGGIMLSVDIATWKRREGDEEAQSKAGKTSRFWGAGADRTGGDRRRGSWGL